MPGSPEKGFKDAGIEPGISRSGAISVNHLTTTTLARMLNVNNYYAPISRGNLFVYDMGSGISK